LLLKLGHDKIRLGHGEHYLKIYDATNSNRAYSEYLTT
jgi:hypothetical protein